MSRILGGLLCALLAVTGADAQTSTRTASYTEATMTNLAAVRLYYRLNNGPEQMVSFPASSPTGGQPRTQTFTVAASSGTLVGALTSVTTTSAESVRSPLVTYQFGTPPPTGSYTLTATSQGAGTVSGAGAYPAGTVVTPVANAAAGSTFSGWSGDCTGMSCTVTMTANKAVTATFTGGTTPPPTACAITPTPTAITFTHPPGGPLPPPQSLRVVTSDGSPYKTFDTGFYDAAPCYTQPCPSGTLTTITPMPTTLSLAAGTYTYPLDLTAGPACPKVSVPVVLTIGATPVPPVSMGKLTVEAQVTRCNYFLTAEPPDTTGGWVAQFLRDGANTVGNPISTPPYRRSVELYAPSHSFTVEFSKTGTIKRSPAVVTRTCP